MLRCKWILYRTVSPLLPHQPLPLCTKLCCSRWIYQICLPVRQVENTALFFFSVASWIRSFVSLWAIRQALTDVFDVLKLQIFMISYSLFIIYLMFLYFTEGYSKNLLCFMFYTAVYVLYEVILIGTARGIYIWKMFQIYPSLWKDKQQLP